MGVVFIFIIMVVVFEGEGRGGLGFYLFFGCCPWKGKGGKLFFLSLFL